MTKAQNIKPAYVMIDEAHLSLLANYKAIVILLLAELVKAGLDHIIIIC